MMDIVHSTECQEARAKEQAAIRAWTAKWPNYCRGCHANGGAVSHNYPHTPDDYDICEDCVGKGICGRCGEPGLTSEERGDTSTGDGPCKACGWNYHDSRPEPLCDPCPCEEAAFRAEDAAMVAEDTDA